MSRIGKKKIEKDITKKKISGKSNFVLIITSIVIAVLLIGSIVLLIIHLHNKNSNEEEVIIKEKELEVKEKYSINIGDDIPDAKLYFNNYNDEKIDDFRIYKDGNVVDSFSVGDYDVEIIIDGNSYKSVLSVIDNEKPNLVVKNVSIVEGTTYVLNDFVDSCVDNSKDECNISFMNEEMASYVKPGEYDVTLIAKDNSGNESINGVKLVINKKNDVSDKNNNNNVEKNNTSKVVTKDSQNTSNNKTQVVDKTSDSGSSNSSNTNNQSSSSSSNTPLKMFNVTLVMDEGRNTSIIGVLENSTLPKDVQTTRQGRKFKEWQLNGKTFDVNTKITSDLKLVAVYSDVPVITYKYGVKISTVAGISTYDYSSFKATTNDMKPEASSVASKNATIYKELLGYVNELRSKEGNKAPLVLDNTLSQAATLRAIEMAWANKFDHTRPNGTSCFSVINEYGIAAWGAGENIAAGQRNAKEAFNSWNKSPGHHANMVGDFTKIGIGQYTLDGATYWVQLFIKD